MIMIIVIMFRFVDEENIGFMIKFDPKIYCNEMIIDGVEDLRNYAKYIMEQYVYEYAEYRVNISSYTRLNLLKKENEFHKRNNDIMTSSMEVVLDSLEEGMVRSISDVSSVIQILSEDVYILMADYVVMFDKAMEEIVALLKTDSLSRFYTTKEYKTMMQSCGFKN